MKKAQTKLLMPIFKIILVIFVLVVILYKIFNLYGADVFAVKASAVDANLLVESLLSLPEDTNADILFSFPVKSSVSIKPNVVKFVKDKALSAEYYFSSDPGIDVKDADFEDINSFYMIRNGDSLSFSREEPSQISLYNCPKIYLNFDKIFVDSPVEDKFAHMAAQLLGKSRPYFEYLEKTEDTKFNDLLKSLKDKIKSDDALISIKQGDFDEDLIKIYINPDKRSMAVACSILNSLINDFHPENTAIIPVNFDLLLDEVYKNILNLKVPSILIEVGKQNINIISKHSDFVKSIDRGVEKYA